jgi:hypothetical protein
MQKLVFPNPLSTDREFVFPPAQPEFEGSAEDVFFIHSPGEAPAIERDVQSRMRDTVHLLDYVPVEEHAAIFDGTTTYDVIDHIHAAIEEHTRIVTDTLFQSTSLTLLLPRGKIYIGAPIQLKWSTRLIGAGTTNGTVIEVAEDQHGIIVHRFDTYDGDTAYQWVSTHSAWDNDRAYVVNQIRTNDGGKIYACVQAGTSAGSGGPTGTGSGIVDGTVVWDYQATTYIAGQVVYGAVDFDSGIYECVTPGGGAAANEPFHQLDDVGVDEDGDLAYADGYTWRFIFPGRGGDLSHLEHFSLQSLGGTLGHGVWMRARATIDSVDIHDFPQNGVHIVAGATASGALRGNANNFRINNGRIEGSGAHGLFIDGADANAGVITGLDTSANLGWGLWDDSFLGNVFYGVHTNGNGEGGRRQWERFVYVCVDGDLGATTEPGTDPDVWWFAATIGGDFVDEAVAWTSGDTYSAGDQVQGSGAGDGVYECTVAGGGASTNEPTHPSASQAYADGYTWKVMLIDWISGTDYTDGGTGTFGTADAIEAPNGAVYVCEHSPGGGALSTVAPTHAGTTPVVESDGYSWDIQNSNAVWFNGDTTIIEGGCFKTVGDSQIPAFFGCYAEAGQPVQMSSGTLAIYPGYSVDNLTEGSTGTLWNQVGTNHTRIHSKDSNGDTWEIQIGGYRNFTSNAIIAFVHDTLASGGLVEALDLTDGSLELLYNNSAATRIWSKTLDGTTLTFGRDDPVPHALYVDNLFVGASTTSGRQITNSSASPTSGQWAAGDLVLNSAPLLGEPWGWRCILTGDFAGVAPVFQPLRDHGSQQTIATNANFTLTPGTSPHRTLHTGTLTANRAVTLSTTGALIGLSYRITRTGAGAFDLNVGSGPLKALATNTWCEVVYDGSAYYLSAYGAL